MLGSSFGSSNNSHEEVEEEVSASAAAASDGHQYIMSCQNHHHQIQEYHRNISPAIHMRQLLISCAELISRPSPPPHHDLSPAHRLITILFAHSAPCGDSTERLVHHFTKPLSLRLNNSPIYHHHNATSSAGPPPTALPQLHEWDHEALLQSSYLSLNQVTPFIRFCHLTANQAILDAIDTEASNSIHILDFNIMHGLQWPPFMQALVERYPPPALRITGTGSDLQTLRRTGDRLTKFAHSLGLTFQFHPLLILDEDHDPISAAASSLHRLPGETLAVNCVLYLHRLLKDRDKLRLFLHTIKSMNPKVVTVAEREANHNHPVLVQRFVEALDHYAAVFDSLEATLPPNSRERLNVEQVWLGREIYDIVAASEEERRERHERFRSWEVMFRSSGFNNVPLSPFALSQAKLLLRLHYPSEGYQLHNILNDSFFLGWQNQPLFSVSSWR